jgi:hypothetical protein
MISPKLLAQMTEENRPVLLPYSQEYGTVEPTGTVEAQAVVHIPITVGKHQFEIKAVVADIDCSCIIGLDFIFENDFRIHPQKRKVKVGKTKKTIPLDITKKILAQWVKSAKAEHLQPGEERFVRIRFTDMPGRSKPAKGELGVIEPATSMRSQGGMVIHSIIEAQETKEVMISNLGDQELFISPGDMLGYWVPAEIVSSDIYLDEGYESNLEESSQEEDQLIRHKDLQESNDTEFASEYSRFDQGYCTDYESEEDNYSSSDKPEVRIRHVHLSESQSGRVLKSAARSYKRPQKKATVPLHLQKLVDESDLARAHHREQLTNLLLEYEDVMAGPDQPLGRTSTITHHIDTGDHRPIKQSPRRPPISMESAEEIEVDKMLQQGVVKPSESPWASPVVLVKKKDGSIRFCVDYRKLNDVTRKDAYPLPRIDDSLDCLSGATWFCTLDLLSGYWQVPVAEKDMEKTAFVTKSGLYEYLVMPFGLTNAPATFERLMERVLRGLQWRKCLVYIDDIIIFGKDFTETLANLRCVFLRLREAHLTCKPKKCEMFKKEVNFLGHVVSGDGIKCDPRKTDAVRNWPTPTNLKEVRSFLGLASYYRRFIQDFATISAPLTELTKKNVKFHWTEVQEQAFQRLKDKLCSEPVLAYPTADGFFILDTDASNYGIGAVLSQVQNVNEEPRVIAYASKTLSDSQKAYCTTWKELLAVVYFVKHFRRYLYGRRFLLRTDHAALVWLLNFKNPEGIVARWITALTSYMPFDCIQHRH